MTGWLTGVCRTLLGHLVDGDGIKKNNISVRVKIKAARFKLWLKLIESSDVSSHCNLLETNSSRVPAGSH